MELMVSPRLRATTPKAEAPRTETADQRRMEAIRLEVIRVPVASASSRLALLLSTREIKPPTFRYNPSMHEHSSSPTLTHPRRSVLMLERSRLSRAVRSARL